jgi:glycerol-3-phosphate dehydrogenase
MKVAVIGGGINGLCSAWKLAQEGHTVTLFERDSLMGATSQASSKLLHGGLRYLESYDFALVKEALHERKWWLENAPLLTRRLPIIYPLYNHTRSRLKLKLGLYLYDKLAGNRGIGKHFWLTPKQVKRISPFLTQANLKGAYLFHDGQMDDYALGLWVAEQCKLLGVAINEHCAVNEISTSGAISTRLGDAEFDLVVNVAGPWSTELLDNNGIAHQSQITLVRGSHLVLPSISKFGHMLEVPGEKRIVFALPYKQQTLFGTTEVEQSVKEPITCSDLERDYLLNCYNAYFAPNISKSDIIDEFSGARPIVSGEDGISTLSREYKISVQNRLISVFGGKWTTARALAEQVAKHANKAKFLNN